MCCNVKNRFKYSNLSLIKIPKKILICALFLPGTPGGDWVIMQHLLRGVEWKGLAWWSFLGGESPLMKTLGDRLSAFNAPCRLAPARKWRWLRGILFERVVIPLAARHLRRFIVKEKPAKLWVVSYGWAIPVFYRVIPKLGIPWHFSMHDMPDTDEMKKLLGPSRARRFMHMQERLYRGAVSRNVVGSVMGEEMCERTGIKAEFEFRCSVEPEDLEKMAVPKVPHKEGVLNIGYAGTIIAEDAFEFLVKTLEQIKQTLLQPVRIHLFSSHSYKERPWFNPEFIIEHGHLSFQELQKPYAACDWGLVLMQMHDDDPRYNRFSFPCKFTQTLAAGLPMICIGNSKSSLIRLARNFELGILITEMDRDKVTKTLAAQLADNSKTTLFRSEIHRCASTLFNAESMRRGMRSFLTAD